MDSPKTGFTSIEYIATFPAEIQAIRKRCVSPSRTLHLTPQRRSATRCPLFTYMAILSTLPKV
ncbi:MAG: hypothetical protein R2873_15500 [Caldilineaceae bacterium]